MHRARLYTLAACVALTIAAPLVLASPAAATPPGVPSVTTTRSELATLTVAAWTHTTTYQRSLFPTWGHDLRQLRHPARPS